MLRCIIITLPALYKLIYVTILSFMVHSSMTTI